MDKENKGSDKVQKPGTYNTKSKKNIISILKDNANRSLSAKEIYAGVSFSDFEEKDGVCTLTVRYVDFEKLKEQNIIARKYFYPLINGFECYKDYKTAGEDKTPVAKHIADRVLTLPLFADLTPDTVDLICDIILQ